MSLRYKIGDRVELGNADVLKEYSIFKEYRHCIGTITEIDDSDEREPYKAVFEDGQIWWTNDDCIDHEATARLNEPKYELKTDDNGIYLTSQLLEPLINSTANKEDIKKGSDKMNANEILEKWRNKKADELISQQDEEIKKVTKEDEIQKLVKEHEAEINKIIKEKYKIDTEVSKIFCTITTRKTGDKIEAINKEFDKKAGDVAEKVDEIKAVLEVAENQDKVFEILNKQGIIDKNYNIL